MKIEIFIPQQAQNLLLHITSNERKQIDLPKNKKEGIYPAALDYIEKYMEENGFKLQSVDQGFMYIVKD